MNIDKIITVLNDGGVIVMPTDTVYGIICDATNKDAVKKVFNLKKRNFSKPLIVLVSDVEMLNKCSSNINSLEKKIINKYLPGKLTLILKKSTLIPDIVTANMDSVGIRIPDDKNLIDLIKKFGKPIVATSANISAHKVITTINLLENHIKENVDYIVDCGYINNDTSTIVKVNDNRIEILREGELSSNIRKNFK